MEVECSLLYLDLRQFRIINDSAGYEAGDQISERCLEASA